MVNYICICTMSPGAPIVELRPGERSTRLRPGWASNRVFYTKDELDSMLKTLKTCRIIYLWIFPMWGRTRELRSLEEKYSRYG